MDWVDAAMEEYKTLRQEVQTSISAQQSILSFGTATLGFVFGAGVSLWERSLAPIVVFSVLVPLLSGLILLIWLAETMRMVRAGNYLSVLERDIAAAGQAAGDWNDIPPLRWECRLREGKDRLRFRRFVLAWPEVFLIEILIALTSLVVAFVNDHDQGGLSPWTFVFSGVALVFLALVIVSAWIRWWEAKNEFEHVLKEHSEQLVALSTPVR